MKNEVFPRNKHCPSERSVDPIVAKAVLLGTLHDTYGGEWTNEPAMVVPLIPSQEEPTETH